MCVHLSLVPFACNIVSRRPTGLPTDLPSDRSASVRRFAGHETTGWPNEGTSKRTTERARTPLPRSLAHSRARFLVSASDRRRLSRRARAVRRPFVRRRRRLPLSLSFSCSLSVVSRLIKCALTRPPVSLPPLLPLFLLLLRSFHELEAIEGGSQASVYRVGRTVGLCVAIAMPPASNVRSPSLLLPAFGATALRLPFRNGQPTVGRRSPLTGPVRSRSSARARSFA